MKVSIIIATCFRWQLLQGMIESLYSTTKDRNVELETVYVIDEDVLSFDAACRFPEFNEQVIDFSPKKRGALAAWNRGLQLSSGDIIVPAGDDQKFHDGWLEFALESHREHLGGYGVVGMNDLAYNGNEQIATMYMMDRQFIKDHLGGVLCPPCYHYYNVDSEINEKARRLGKFWWDERAKVEHLHPAHGKRDADRHDWERAENEWMRIDREMFEARMANGFPITWESLI